MAFFWRHATAMVALVGASSVPHLITNRIFCKQSDAQDTKCKESLGTDATNDKESTSGVVVVKKNPKCPRIVVLGSGWGAMTFVKNLQVKACEVGSNHTGKQNEFEVVVISPRNYFLMTPLLPQVTTGVLNARSIIVPFRRLMNSSLGKNAVFLEAECTSIDTTKQVIACRDSSPIQSSSDRFDVEYDYLVVAVGAENNTFNTPGVKENCFFLKEIRDSLKIRTSVIDLIETASLPSTSNEERKNLLHFVIVGGGPTGVEFAAELADLLHKDMSTLFPKVCNSNVKITLIQSADHILNCFDEAMSKFAEEQFKKEGVEIRLNTRVTEVGPNVITIVDKMTKKKEEIHFGLCLWATGISPRPLIKDLIQALPGQTKKNALATDQNLRVIGVPQQNVYALGDCATVVGAQTVNKVVEMFNSHDSNKDGQLDQDEFDAFLDVTMKKYPQIRLLLEKSRSILSGKKTMALFSAFDKNKDGKISKDELKELLVAADSLVTAFPATAQVAAQQGHYLAEVFNSSHHSADKKHAPFVYNHMGSFTYVGGEEAAADVLHVNLSGLQGNLLWRGASLMEIPELMTSFAVLTDWIRTYLVGRDISRF